VSLNACSVLRACQRFTKFTLSSVDHNHLTFFPQATARSAERIQVERSILSVDWRGRALCAMAGWHV
jgi:hypothetical protein